jgi:hypothetical protein
LTVAPAGTQIETRHPRVDKAWNTDELVTSFDSERDTYVQTLRTKRGDFKGMNGRPNPPHKNCVRMLRDRDYVHLNNCDVRDARVMRSCAFPALRCAVSLMSIVA